MPQCERAPDDFSPTSYPDLSNGTLETEQITGWQHIVRHPSE